MTTLTTLNLKIGAQLYENVALLAFDKDGTLVDFDQMWSHVIEGWIRELVRVTNAPTAVRLALEHTLGYDRARRAVVPDSPLAVASLAKLRTIAMAVFYQYGLPWHTAEALVATHTNQINITPADIHPLGDVAGKLHELHHAGLKLMLITTDDRATTEQILHHMGIASLFTAVVCGDDPLPNKPAPDGLLTVAAQLNISPSQIIMVGDTVNDMNCGRNAGVRACVGVTGGGGNAAALQTTADVLITTIDEINKMDK